MNLMNIDYNYPGLSSSKLDTEGLDGLFEHSHEWGKKMEDGDLTIAVRTTQHSSGGLELLRFQTSDAWQHLAQILVVFYGFWMSAFSFVAQIIVNPHLFPIYFPYSPYISQICFANEAGSSCPVPRPRLGLWCLTLDRSAWRPHGTLLDT